MKKIWTLGFGLLSTLLIAQTNPFDIYIEPIQVPGLGGLQSYAFGQHDGKWLLVGGRTDGLHRRQPWAAFDVAGNNNQFIVVDPQSLQKWSAPITSLPVAMQEQLSSTNMSFYQTGPYLYLVGGYGYNASSNSKITFENLSAIDVPAAIQAVINGSTLAPHVRQISDPEFAVAGGHLKKINHTYYLVGGNRFDGDYNPMGNPTYVQTYTDAIRKFDIVDNGNSIQITHLTGHIDAANLHRRDYNAVAQIYPDGSQGITAFSGVFQPQADLPFLNCVNIDSNSYTVNNTFQQYYNHYHCAVLPLYHAGTQEMHNVFFGGIAQYFDSLGVLFQDDNVPFVKTIARVTREANGQMAEYKLPVKMPTYLGSGSEFIPIKNIPHYANSVIKLDSLQADSTLVGYIYGGIQSTAPNIFFSNTGTQSSASSSIFKVYVLKSKNSDLHSLNSQSVGTHKLQIYPNPNDGKFRIRFYLEKESNVRLSIYDIKGQKIMEEGNLFFYKGYNDYSIDQIGERKSGQYILQLDTENESSRQKFILGN